MARAGRLGMWVAARWPAATYQVTGAGSCRLLANECTARQKVLSNAPRHAAAEKETVRICVEGEFLVPEISDGCPSR